MVRSQQHAVVLDRAGVVRAAKVPRGDLVEEVEHRDVDGLLGRGKQRPVGRRADADVLVGVDADRKLLVLVHVLDRAVARGAGDRVHDVHALVGEGRRELLALGRIAPRVVAAGAADEGAGRARILEGAVPTEQLDRGGLLLVVVLDARVQAVHEARDAREGEAAVGADLMGLAPARTEVAREHRGLVDLVVEAGEVRRLGGVIGVAAGEVRAALVPCGVDLRERDGRVRRGRVGRRLGLQEADRDDRLAALVDQGLDVVGVVGRALRLAEVRREASRAGVLEPLLREVVEALVTKAAGVEGDARNRLRHLGRRDRRGRRRGSRGRLGRGRSGSARRKDHGR